MPTPARLPTPARQAVDDSEVLLRRLHSIGPENMDTRARAFKALLPVAQANPERLLPQWNALAGLLKSDRAFSKYRPST